MTLLSRFLARLYKLPPAETYAIAIDKGLAVPMADGVTLRADRYYPLGAPTAPTVLIRTPYGRSRLGVIWGQLFAERGFQVVIQSCRGTDDSGGTRNPFRGEREDGLATLTWLQAEDWFDGRLGMAGPSYMGFTQWAIASEAGPMLKALCTHVTSSEFRSGMYPGESFNLALWLQWIQITHSFSASLPQYLNTMVTANRRLREATSRLPLREADTVLVGKPVPFWRDWLEHTEPADPWWASEDHSLRVADASAPNHLISGWYDLFLPQLLRDYAVLRQAGHAPYLTIGPWSHSSNALAEAGLRESLIWLRAHLLGGREALRAAPVRIYVMGADEWRDLPSWPPTQIQMQRWHLHPDAALVTAAPPNSQPSRFQYDPLNPTPSVGGAINATLGRGAGTQDNHRLEARPDVLVFTSAPLERDLEIIGPVSAEVFLASSLEHTDLFVRLCDVYADGRSMNVCDGLQRLFPNSPAPDTGGCRRVCIDLWPTAYRFTRGHRIRVQVSSGAFPRFARNLGTGEPLATGTAMRVAQQQVYHDPARPSAILLPAAQA